MDASQRRTFYYHADASPVGGYLTEPVKTIIHTRGSSSLSQAGGHAHRRTGAFRVHDVLSVRQARSEIFGTVDSKTEDWTTVTTSVVEGVNILDVLKADSIVSRLVVSHPRDGRHATVNFVGCQIENLTIAGKPVHIDFNLGQFSRGGEHGNYGDRPWSAEGALVGRAVAQHQAILRKRDTPEWLRKRSAWMVDDKERQQRGYSLCSLVNEVKGTRPEHSFGHVLHVPDFGNIFLGELLVYQHSYRITMLRAELGCAARGICAFSCDGSNGSPMP